MDIRISKAATALARLGKRVWNSTMLTISTKMKVYQASMLSTLLYGSETWTPSKSADSTSSTCAASEGFWASPDKTVSQTRMSRHRREYLACSPCLVRDSCAGLATSSAWRMEEFLRTCSTARLLLELDL